MSAFNVGKKVSAAVRILQRERDASARATHLVGKKYPLITYEKALLSQATGGKFPSVTFIERKQMSTKTSIKRIALVAAAALTLGGFSAVSAHASLTTGTTSSAFTGTGYSNSGSSVTQVVGVPATLTLTIVNALTSTSNVTSSSINSTGVGVISATTAVTNGFGDGAGATRTSVALATGAPGAGHNTTVTYPTSALQFYADTYAGETANETSTITLSVFSSVAGTQTVTATIIQGGLSVGTATGTVTWTSTAGAIGAQAANSVSGFVTGSSNAACTAESTIGAANAFFTASGTSSQYYGTSSTVVWCAYYFDANGNAITPISASLFGASGTISATNISSNGVAAVVTGDGFNKNAASYTSYAKDSYGNTVTLTTPFTWYGKVASIALAANVVADNASSTHASLQAYDDNAGNTDATKGIHSIAITLKDSAGNVIPFSNWSSVTNDVSAANTWILSDKGNGNTSTKKGDTNAYATLTLGANNDHGASSKNNGGFTVGCNAAGKYEHLKIVAYAYDSVTGLDDFASNAVDFYCSGSATAVTVTAPATADAGNAVTVNALATDANGYPVADGTKVVFAASNGGIFLGGDAGTTGGTLTNPTNLIAGSQGDNVVTALVQGATPITGTATVSVNGGVAGSSSLALDAANAATDAANNAYDEAQNATQAASDALAAVTALSAQVGALIATVKSLAAVVAKIKAKVKA